MYLVEVRWPGTWISGDLDQGSAHQAQSILHLMESRLFEAVLALAMFEQSQAEGHARFNSVESHGQRWEEERVERGQIENELRAALPDTLGPEQRWEAERSLYERARRIQLQRRFSRGEVPESYLHQIPFLHARSFLTAIDSIAQAVDQMIGEGWEVEGLTAAAEIWEAKVPNVRAVRNTTAHESERALLKKQGGKPITLQPIENGLFSAPDGGALILNSLVNNRFGCTMADGHYGEVEVSVSTLADTAEFVQAVLDAFVWTGPERWAPYNGRRGGILAACACVIRLTPNAARPAQGEPITAGRFRLSRTVEERSEDRA